VADEAASTEEVNLYFSDNFIFCSFHELN